MLKFRYILIDFVELGIFLFRDFDEVLEAGFVLIDESGIVKKIPIEIRIIKPQQFETTIEKLEIALDGEIFTMRQNRVFPEGHVVKYVHGVTLLCLVMFLLLSRKLFLIFTDRKRRGKSSEVDLFE